MSSSVTRVLRWPLWSWRNLTVTGAAALALLAVVGRATDGQQSGQLASAPASTTAPTTPVTAAPTSELAPTTHDAPSAPAAQTVAPGSATDVAVAFVTAWANDPQDADSWRAVMARWATPELLTALDGTDPAQVPADRVVADAHLKATSGSASSVIVPTDGGPVEVSLVKAGTGWKVRDIAPADAPPAAETPSLNRATPGT